MKGKVYVSLLLAVCLMLSATLGVAATVAPKGELPIIDEVTPLNFYYQGTLTDDAMEKLDQNGVLLKILNDTNVKMEFTFISEAEGKQTIQLAFAAEDYPDGALLDWSTQFTRAEVMQYGVKDGYLLPLNELLDKYGDNIAKIFEENPVFKAASVAPDGNIYGLPRFSECGHCMSYPKLWFNYAWMEKLGLEEPQTTEELEAVLVAFKTQDPNGNGIADEIPLTGNIDYSCALEYYLMNSFLYCSAVATGSNPREFLSWMDDKVTFIANRDEYKEGLEWIKGLYDQGLIDPANFTQDDESMLNLCRQDPLVVGGYTTDHLSMGVAFDNNADIASQYHALPPVAGPEGVRYQSYVDAAQQTSGFHFALFDKCSNPEAAIRLADYLCSEEMTFTSHYGVEGIGWAAPEDPNALNILGGPLKCVQIVLPDTATEEEKNFQALNQFWIPFMGDTFQVRGMWMPEATEESLNGNYETRLQWETNRTIEYWPEVSLPRDLFMDADTSAEFSELKTNIVNHVMKNTSMFITGARSLDEWDAYCQELEAFQVDKYVEIFAKAYEPFKQALES